MQHKEWSSKRCSKNQTAFFLLFWLISICTVSTELQHNKRLFAFFISALVIAPARSFLAFLRICLSRLNALPVSVPHYFCLCLSLCLPPSSFSGGWYFGCRLCDFVQLVCAADPELSNGLFCCANSRCCLWWNVVTVLSFTVSCVKWWAVVCGQTAEPNCGTRWPLSGILRNRWECWC